jgi:GT2 family glycosyltransferase
MNKIAAILPTFKRASKLPEVIKNFEETSTNATLYFVITPEDTESKLILDSIGENYFIVDGEYCKAVNYGVAHTKEEFVLFAADDVVFQPGWDKKLLKLTEDKTKHIFGGIDSWKVSKTMKHISHAMIRRSYIKGDLFYPEYIHYNEDVELLQRGWKAGCVVVTPEILIEHPHPYNDNVPLKKWDATYKHSYANAKRDGDLFNRRKAEFEMWDYRYMHEGIAVPTKLNPLYNETLISIVIPSYNDADYLKQCLQSISHNTYYRYEIIIIDDHSDPIQKTGTDFDLIDTQKLLDAFIVEDKSCSLRVIRNEKQQWINYNWNLGAREAKGNYVAILNSDLTVNKDWDKFLVAALSYQSGKFTISCPFETRPNISKPFALDPFIAKYFPNMIKGACFMFRKENVPNLFPIPSNIKHWCGDNVLADRANKMGGVIFINKTTIFHYGSKSSNRLNMTVLTDRVYQDLLAYEKWSGNDMLPFRKRFPQYERGDVLIEE